MTLSNGDQVIESLDNPNAHSLGASPFARADYIGKLRTMGDGVADPDEIDRFIGLVEDLERLSADDVARLNIVVPADRLQDTSAERVGIL